MLSRTAAYSVRGGARKTLSLTLTADARTMMRTRRSLRDRVAAAPRTGATVAKLLTLRR